MKTKITSTLILDTLKAMVESKKMIPKEEWLNVAGKLELLKQDETKLLNIMRQKVAVMKRDLLRMQEKKNVAACEIEVEASNEFRLMKDQEDLVDTIEQFVMIAKQVEAF